MRSRDTRTIVPGRGFSARPQSGFSLIELMVAMGVFLVIGGAAVSLVTSHAKLNTSTQRQVELTMTLRNAVAMMEVDASNAGAGFFSTQSNPTDFPIGITLQNQPQGGGACNVGTTYNAGCFDTLNIITTDSNVAAAHPTTAINTDNQSSVIVTPPTGIASSTYAGFFKNGDELLWLKPGSPKGTITTTNLTADGKDLTGTVQLNFTSTKNGGINPNEKYLITSGLGNDAGDSTVALTNSFVPGTDWVMKLNAITYFVDTTIAGNPRLMRKQGLSAAPADEIASQIIGFRVGASIRHTVAGADQLYSFNSTGQTAAQGCTVNCGYNNDWTEIRSLRISLLGRTSPTVDVNNPYQNKYDKGPYKIQGLSVTINPRNLSMNDL